jgi:hypothetical protein
LLGPPCRATLARTFCSSISFSPEPETALRVAAPPIFSRAEATFFFSRSTSVVLRISIS